MQNPTDEHEISDKYDKIRKEIFLRSRVRREMIAVVWSCKTNGQKQDTMRDKVWCLVCACV